MASNQGALRPRACEIGAHETKRAKTQKETRTDRKMQEDDEEDEAIDENEDEWRGR